MSENQEIKTQEEQPKKAAPIDLKTKVLGQFTQYEINTLRNTIAGGLDGNEFGLYINTAINAGLNPMLGHIIPVLYSADDPTKRKLNIQIPVEGIEHLARQKEGWQGVETQLVCEKDVFKVNRDKETGNWIIEEHEISFPRGKTVGAYCIAKRTGFKDAYIFMEVNEVEHLTKNYKTKDMWTLWFNDMFKKHIKKRALREQFGIELDDIENATGGPQQYENNSSLQNYEPGARKEIGQDEGPDQEQLLEQYKKEIEGIIFRFNLTIDEVNSVKARQLSLDPDDEMSPQQIAVLKRFLEIEAPGIDKQRRIREEQLKQAPIAQKPPQEEPQQEIVEEKPKEPNEWEDFFNFEEGGTPK